METQDRPRTFEEENPWGFYACQFLSSDWLFYRKPTEEEAVALAASFRLSGWFLIGEVRYAVRRLANWSPPED